MRIPQRALISIVAGLLAALALLLLTGCGGEKVVSVPTPVACVKSADIPAEPDRVSASLTGSAEQDAAILAVLALDLRDYAGKLRALLRGCE